MIISPYVVPGLTLQALHYDKSYEELLEIVVALFNCKRIPVNRKREIVEPRQVAWYCLRLCHGEDRKITLKMIADSFWTDHSNIYSGINHVEDMLETNKKFKNKYKPLIDKFRYDY